MQYGSSSAVGAVFWSATDGGKDRTAPYDVGAFQR